MEILFPRRSPALTCLVRAQGEPELAENRNWLIWKRKGEKGEEKSFFLSLFSLGVDGKAKKIIFGLLSFKGERKDVLIEMKFLTLSYIRIEKNTK